MTTFRATLRLERVEPYTADGGYARELYIELSSHTVTGDTPADAMVQLCAHADSLYEWHQQQAEEAAPVLDEAVRLGPPAFDLSKLFPRLFAPPPLHHCAVCGKPGPIKYEGNTWTCADCNAVLDAQKAEQAARADETHDAYGTPITPPFNPPPSSGDRFCQPCGDVFGPLHACFEDEPGQEGAEAENDPAFADTEADRDEEMRAALATDPAQVRIDEMARGETVAPPAGMPIVITTGPQPDPEAFRHLLREEMNRRGGRNRA